LLPHLRTAEQFAAVLDASKQRKNLAQAQMSHEATSAGRNVQGVYRSAHFALHVAGAALWPERPAQQATLGVIAPKRWAKRAVTRNLIKRQVYAVSHEMSARLPCAYLVVRQHAAFSREQFISASSKALKLAVRQELQQLLAQVAQSE
jgi:ribonuclease P protein component